VKAGILVDGTYLLTQRQMKYAQEQESLKEAFRNVGLKNLSSSFIFSS